MLINRCVYRGSGDDVFIEVVEMMCLIEVVEILCLIEVVEIMGSGEDVSNRG